MTRGRFRGKRLNFCPGGGSDAYIAPFPEPELRMSLPA
jgi:hypothetical protein